METENALYSVFSVSNARSGQIYRPISQVISYYGSK